jgi:hypothetical protein
MDIAQVSRLSIVQQRRNSSIFLHFCISTLSILHLLSSIFLPPSSDLRSPPSLLGEGPGVWLHFALHTSHLVFWGGVVRVTKLPPPSWGRGRGWGYISHFTLRTWSFGEGLHFALHSSHLILGLGCGSKKFNRKS